MEAKILEGIQSFIATKGFNPKKVYLGSNEWISLKTEVYEKGYFKYTDNPGNEIHGLVIHLVTEESHFNIT